MDEMYEGLADLRSDRLRLTQTILHDCAMTGFRNQTVRIIDGFRKAGLPE